MTSSAFSTQLRSRLPLISIMVGYLVVMAVTFDQIEEDAFIYLRLAANLAAGHGYVFNIGGEPIEAGSSLIWQFAIVPLQWLPLDPIVSLKLLSVVWGCVTLWLITALSRELIGDSWIRCLPAALLVVSVPFYTWSQRGLETPLYLALLLALCLVCVVERWRPHWYWVAIAVFCARPEGFVMLAAPIACVWVERSKIPDFWRGLGVLVLAGVVITLGRLWYFHDPFPHPFYIKAGSTTGLASRVALRFMISNGPIVLMLPLLVGMCRREFWNRRLAIVMVFLVVTGLWGLSNTEMQPYDRHLAPFLVFFFVASAASLDLWTRSQAARLAIRVGVVVLPIAILVFARNPVRGAADNLFLGYAQGFVAHPAESFSNLAQLLADPSKLFVEADQHPLPHHRINTNYQATTGQFLRDNYPENIAIVYDQMGQAAWYAGRDKVVIDSFGLLDKRLGYYSFHERAQHSAALRLYESGMLGLAGLLWPEEQRLVTSEQALDSIFDQRPELILINSFVVKAQPDGLPGRISRDPRLASEYTAAYRVNRLVSVHERNDLGSPDRPIAPWGATVKNLADPGQR